MPLENHKHGYLLERVGHLGQTFILLSFYKITLTTRGPKNQPSARPAQCIFQGSSMGRRATEVCSAKEADCSHIST